MWEGGLIIRHLIIDNQGMVFVSAKDVNGEIYNFIVNSQNGTVSIQINSHFEPLLENLAEYIRKKVEQFYDVVPTYRVREIKVS
jgi:hypothetical protein